METRYFPKDHNNPRCRGARIVAFEGNQEFLDSLHAFHKDYPFNIRFGGNLYIRGGDRYLKRKNVIYNLATILTNLPPYLNNILTCITYLTLTSFPTTVKRNNVIYTLATILTNLLTYLINIITRIKSLTLPLLPPDVIQTIRMRPRATAPASTGRQSRSCLAGFQRASSTPPTPLRTTLAGNSPMPKWGTTPTPTLGLSLIHI